MFYFSLLGTAPTSEHPHSRLQIRRQYKEELSFLLEVMVLLCHLLWAVCYASI